MSKSFRSCPSSFAKTLLVLLATSAALLAAGCGIGTLDTAPSAGDPVRFSGQVIGGENPVIWSAVSFYETAATGTATNGVYVPSTPLTPLGTTYTDVQGNYSFATPVACTTSTDYVYAVAAGGNPGLAAGSLNPQTLLMTAVGPCTSVNSNSTVIINELSTVVAATALSGFTSVSGSYTTATGSTLTASTVAVASGVATVNVANTLVSGQPVALSGFSKITAGSYTVISANSGSFTVAVASADSGASTDAGSIIPTTVTSLPKVSVVSSATNYTGTSGAGVVGNYAGLAHAFSNASVLMSAAYPYPNRSVPGTSSGTGGTVTPVSLINTLGNTIQACVNSSGGSASSISVNDGTSCGKLFSYTTTPTGAASTIVVPTNTLTALLNTAHYPALVDVADMFSLGSSSAAFAPALSAAPNDWSLGIQYLKGSLVSTNEPAGLIYPVSLTLDANDNVFIANTNASSETQSNIIAINNTGAVLGATAIDTTIVTYPVYIVADNLGNLFMNAYHAASTGNSIQQYTTASGGSGLTITPGINISSLGYSESLAVDSSNNLWLGTLTTHGSLAEYVYTNTGGTVTYPATSISPTAGAYSEQLAIDSTGNVWAGSYSTSTASFPRVYPTSHPTDYVYATGTGTTYNYGVVVDSAGNAWTDSSPAASATATPAVLFKTTPSGNPVTAATTSTAITFDATAGASVRFMSIDGNNSIYAANYQSGGNNSTIDVYPSTAPTPTPYRLKPCISNAATCPTGGTGTTAGIYYPRYQQADSSGNLWVACASAGSIIEIVGVAAPTIPLQAAQKPGIMP